MTGKTIAKLQHSQEFVKEIRTAKMSEALVITGDSQISRRMAPDSGKTFLRDQPLVLRMLRQPSSHLHRHQLQAGQRACEDYRKAFTALSYKGVIAFLRQDRLC
jgi:hypothetical protein